MRLNFFNMAKLSAVLPLCHILAMKLYGNIYFLLHGKVAYFSSIEDENAMVFSSITLLSMYIVWLIYRNNHKRIQKILSLLGIVYIFVMLISLLSDFIWMNIAISSGDLIGSFIDVLIKYFTDEYSYYFLLFFISAISFIVSKIKLETFPKQLFLLPISFLIFLVPYLISWKLHQPLNHWFSNLYFLTNILVFGIINNVSKEYKIHNEFFIKYLKILGFSSSMALLIILALIYQQQAITNVSQAMAIAIKNLHVILPVFILLVLSGIGCIFYKKKQFNIDNADETTGRLGSAKFASKQDIEKINAYDETNGPLIGIDDFGKGIYLPFTNKLTISPPGGGKTTTSSIPILLTYPGPAFVFDIKGELWATTAKYRAEHFGRHVVVIDPYGVTKSQAFAENKPKELLYDYKINPFDFIPENELQRDRMINAFASSFIISDDGNNNARHFDENAKILIRGYIDYMMKKYPPSERNLAKLYQLLSEDMKQSEVTFGDMSSLSGRASAASNQVSRVGMNEKGSILSTSYRQIDWMSDSNMQHILSNSNFSLHDFLKGNMDIFVVLPEDQVKEHSRLVRMIMSLLMGIIVQADPLDLPKQKMLFLLEELAQLGYCPDVEQCIEVLRARGVVVWTVFQSLNQIEMFKKPDLFKGVTLKQIFTLDDVDTMKWIQSLGGKKTILNKTISNTKNDSRKKMQAFGGTISQGSSESVSEIAVDLIQINEIREMPNDTQLVFLHGTKPIKCKKVYYFKHPMFDGKYDKNPLETKS